MDTTTRPPGTERIPLLDVLRGIAILGTLGMNIWLFGHPGAVDYGPVAEGLRTMFLSGKFFTMLTLLFGVGLAIQYRSARERGRSWPGKQPWRALLLLVEGTLHVVLLFAWDVLMGYALTALLVVYLLGLSERTRTVVMWTALGIHLTYVGAVTAIMSLVYSIERQPHLTREQIEWDRLYREGSYSDQVLDRATHFLGTRVEVIVSFPLMVFLFLLGVRLYRAGAFGDDQVGRAVRKRMAVWGLGLGLPLNALAVVHPEALGLAARNAFSLVLMLGYVGLVGVLMDRVRRPGQVTASLTAVGRTALSNYILQNLLASLIFYSWGLGLGQLADHAGLMAAAWAVISLVLLAGSRLWLSRFPRGPMEMFQARVLALVPERDRAPDPPQVEERNADPRG